MSVPLVVAIDGPAGSGKSSVARRVAHELGLPHVDTGAMYRAVTLACLDRGVDPDDGSRCAAIAGEVTVDWEDGRTYLDGDDVEDEIRSPRVTAAVSAVSAHEGVRAAVTPVQRRVVERAGGVVEGRDIGTVVLPDADLKVFLTASIEERARRRAGDLDTGDLARVADELRARDRADTGRSVAPLARADDAWAIDTTDMTEDEVVDAVVGEARVRSAELADPVRARRTLPRVAVVGRPNVGKSTLVNRILGRRQVIVEERPGVTRDRTEHVAEWTGRPFLLSDTGGWEHGAQGMNRRVAEQAERAAESADVVLLVTDAVVGVQEQDEALARRLRRVDVPVLVVANKVDGDRQESGVHALHALGLGAPHPVSARHGRGVGDLLDEVVAALPPRRAVRPEESAVPRVAVVGRPNVGKSSVFNRLLGEERSIVDPRAHTTRDAVDTVVEIDGEPWIFVDTAGLRRRYRRGEDTEIYSVDRTRAALEQASLALFVLDASSPVAEQDQRLAAEIRDAGCGVVVVCNKWDLVDEERRADLERELDRLLRFLTWAPRVNASAVTGRGLRRLPARLREVWDGVSTRIPTRELNASLQAWVERTPPPPTASGRPLRVKYATQVGVRPPTILVFTNAPIPEAYRRYLERRLRETFGFAGAPILIEDRRGRVERGARKR